MRRDVALKSFEHLWEDWGTEKKMRTHRLVFSTVSTYRKHEDF